MYKTKTNKQINKHKNKNKHMNMQKLQKMMIIFFFENMKNTKFVISH